MMRNDTGMLEMNYVHHPLNWTGVGTVLGDVAGSNPAAGDYRHYFHDHLGSTRMLYAQNKALLAQYRFTPYGEAYDLRGAPLTRGFTGQLWDPALGQYYFPMRHYAPGLGRWASREPSGIDGPNLYHYVFGNPIHFVDRRGEMTILAAGAIFGIGAVAVGILVCMLGRCQRPRPTIPSPSITDISDIVDAIVDARTGRSVLPPGASEFINALDPDIARIGFYNQNYSDNLNDLLFSPENPRGTRIPISPIDRRGCNY